MRLRSGAPAGLIAVACAALAAAGCASGNSPATPAVPAAAVVRGVAATEPAADAAPFGAADTGFGLDVLRAWCAEYPGKNLVFSPSTLASALGMAYLGARGTTAKAMAGVLRLPASGGTELDAGLQARSKALTGLNGPGVTLSPSNQVWADPSLPPERGYLDAVATGYGAGVARAPFLSDPAQAAGQVNKDISADTRGHITNLVSPQSVSGVGWVLTSALYLDAKWQTAFDAAKTQAGAFTLADGKTVSAQYLDGDGFSYTESGGWTAVRLPYAGGRLTMTALLPPSGSGSCTLPTQAGLTSMTAALAGKGTRAAPAGARTATIDLPKVSLATSGQTGDMKTVLEELGMGQAFSGTADFTGLSEEAGNLAFVQQAATLKVAEKGTVAAAAAAAGIYPSAAEVDPFVVQFNRPYLLLVSAKATGEPLFLAEVANPAVS